MATRAQINAATATAEFRGLNRGQRARYRAVAGGAKDTRSNARRHADGMRAAGTRSAGRAGG